MFFPPLASLLAAPEPHSGMPRIPGQEAGTRGRRGRQTGRRPGHCWGGMLLGQRALLRARFSLVESTQLTWEGVSGVPQGLPQQGRTHLMKVPLVRRARSGATVRCRAWLSQVRTGSEPAGITAAECVPRGAMCDSGWVGDAREA